MSFSTMHRPALVCASAALVASACASPPPVSPLPSPPPSAPTAVVSAAPAVPLAEALFRTYLDVFNAGDRATLKAFFEKNRLPQAERMDDELQFRLMTGGFELKQVQTSTETSCTGLVKERDSDQFARFEVEVGQDAAHPSSKLSLRAIPAPPEFAVARMTEAEAVEALGVELTKAAAADRFSGAALVAKQGKVLFAHAYGLANRETRTENQLGTQFRLGSMNKMFTAVAVLQLVQAGKIKLDAPLRTYLPDYPNKDLAAKVTIHHLLTHTGGTGDIFGPDFKAHRLELKTLGDYLKLYGTRALSFEPGAEWRYSNSGFILLGAVIEKVSRKSYYDYVRAHVFAPAGMLSTDSQPEEVSVPGRAVGYLKDAPDAGWQPSTDTLPYRGTSAGGGYSTVEDLQRFATALQANLLLDAKHTELLVTPKPFPGSERQYGYGFMTHGKAGLRCFGHDGGAPGMNGELSICPKEGYVIVVLANLDPPAANRASAYVSKRLPLGAAGERAEP